MAYTQSTLLSHLKKYRISSICSFNNYLYIASSDGFVRQYDVNTNIESKKWQLCTNEIEQIDIIEFEGQILVICIYDNYLHVHSYHNLEFLCKLDKSKGCYLFQCNQNNFKNDNLNNAQDDRFSNFLCLCLAVKRRYIMIYNWDPLAKLFLHKVDLSIPDIVSSMNWAGRWICLGFNKREYNLIHFGSGSNKPIFSVGKKGIPVSCLLPNKEILLAKDNLGICIDYDGKPTRQDAIIFNNIPLQFNYHHPYIIAITSINIEIRNIYTGVLIDVIDDIKDVLFMTNHQQVLYLANKTSIEKLKMKPLFERIDLLINQKNFKEALSLVHYSSINEWKNDLEKQDQINAIHTRHAYDLFNKGDYQSAMMYFQQCDCNPRQVLALFPDVLPSGQSNIINFKHPVAIIPINNEENLLQALSALIPFLEMMRGKLLLANKASQSLLHKYDLNLSVNEMKLAVLIDTVLLKAYLLTDDSLVMPFLQQGNQCDIDKSQIVLKAYQKFKELICLYQSRNHHLSALELLAYLGQGTIGGPLYGTNHTVEYLQQLMMKSKDHVKNIELIFEFSKWVLAIQPEEGLRIFTFNHTTLSHLNQGISAYQILEHLKQSSDLEVCIAYLESLINTGETKTFFHNELIFLYLTAIEIELKKNEEKQQQPLKTTYQKISDQVGRLAILRSKLINFLKNLNIIMLKKC